MNKVVFGVFSNQSLHVGLELFKPNEAFIYFFPEEYPKCWFWFSSETLFSGTGISETLSIFFPQ